MSKELTQKEMASRGGKARAKKLSKQRRLEISKMGVEARIKSKSMVDNENKTNL